MNEISVFYNEWMLGLLCSLSYVPSRVLRNAFISSSYTSYDWVVSHSPVRGCARNLILYLYHINSRNDVPYPSRETKNDDQAGQTSPEDQHAGVAFLVDE